MKYRNIFPYTRRWLGLASEKTLAEQERCVERLAILTIVNLQQGDTLRFPKGEVVVDDASSEKIAFTMTVNDNASKHIIDANNLSNNILVTALKCLIPTLSPAYSDPLCSLIERDPSVFRTQAKDGWVINDALCLMSGNISYALNVPEYNNTVVVASDETRSGEQVAFDF